MVNSDVKLLAVLDKVERQFASLSLERGEQGLKGDKGDIGPKGEKGATGTTGAVGATGKAGPSGAKGNTGPKGDNGISIEQVRLDFDNHLVVTLSDGSEIDAGDVNTSSDGLGNRPINVALTKTGNAAKGTQSRITYVSSVADFPTPINSVITLAADETYFICGDVDILGNRLVGAFNTCLLGTSSENAFLTSTGLGVGIPLLYTEWTTPVRHITFRDVDTAIEIRGAVNAPVALDWTGVNFADVPNVGLIDGVSNFIFTKGAFLSAANLRFDGTTGTVSLADSIFVGSGVASTLIIAEDTLVITRRIRMIYSSVVSFGGTAGIDISALATIPTEGFILDTVNFSGGGTYLVDVDQNSNTALFSNCTGIINSTVNGQLYMTGNTTATVVSATNTFYKVLGTTTASAENSKYAHADNRLTNRATVERRYLISCQLAFTAGANNVCEFGFYDSKLGAIRTPSRTKTTANAAGRAENVGFSCVVQHSDGEYLEIHAANTSSTTDIVVEAMNMVITDIK